MDMVFHAAHFKCFHFVLAGNTAQKWPESLTQKRRNHRPGFFGAENSVEIRAHVRHANHSAVPSGLNAMPIFPALKRRAILMMSLRDKARAPIWTDTHRVQLCATSLRVDH